MLGRNIVAGSINQTTYLRVLTDAGVPKTDVVAATGMLVYYVRPGVGKEAITLSDLVAEDSTHSDGGLKHIAGGWYRLDLPDAAVAANSDEVKIIASLASAIVSEVTHPLNVSQVSQLSELDRLTYKGTVTGTPTDGQTFSATITNRDGSQITDTEMVAGALNGKGIVINHVEAGSGTSEADSGLIQTVSHDTGNTWDFILDPVYKLSDTPAVDDTFLISAF